MAVGLWASNRVRGGAGARSSGRLLHCQPPGRFTPNLSPLTSVLRVKALIMAVLGLMANSNQGGLARGVCLAVLIRLRRRGVCFAPDFSALVSIHFHQNRGRGGHRRARQG